MAQPIIHCDPEIQGGVPVFYGARVPVKNLFDYREAGDSLDQFLHSFPSVAKEQAVAALELAREALVAEIEAAWAVEIRERAAAFERGELQTYPAEEVFAEARRIAK